MSFRLGIPELLIILALCIGPLVVLGVILVFARRTKGKTDFNAPTGRAMKKCPFCAEEVRAEAIVCRHCGRDLP